ncbi:MAG: Asp-tRNA(Asn)/Glu-tRNA(Gln) amidotransferase GatCAB subunit B [Candidatus Puniceispirillum sp.]|nr:Asp-tRNA(Asn)/Glu-tRNA(Gln) amidotransferase GatCAB subunit B [Candidatus Pelagibacter sp.]MBA4283171.1 Asp-tRNA(Asn)/Glu-tRNA(Gln) amidotransferase GatCAB subunit B [Candidatus Puniceispirillum sp.]
MSDNTIFVEGQTGLWEIVIGLEVHAQVSSKSKLFSGSSASFGADPNTQVAFLDAGLPGTLPVLNTFCVDQAIKTGLGIHGNIQKYSAFDRKNYFYADLPLGYQISQFYHPIVLGGYITIDLENGEEKKIGVQRIHLEQDAGKSIHDIHPSETYIDLNRAGVALMEIVSEPEIHSSSQAQSYVKKLRTLLRYLQTCDGNMEEGSLRVDANVSLHRPGTPFGTRAEIKNLNSVKFLGQAIDFEVARQLKILESGGTVDQETRLFDPGKGETRTMRSKEDAHDYRYFPDPDLKPLVLEQERIDAIIKSMPELPDEKKKRLIEQYGLSAYDADIIVSERDISTFYETAVNTLSVDLQNNQGPKILANWLISELFGALNKNSLTLDSSPISAEQLSNLVTLILTDVISGKIAKDVFLQMWETGQEAAVIVEEKGLKQISDPSIIENAVDSILSSNSDKVVAYKGGKEQLFGFFVGTVLKHFQGKANPALVNQILEKKLKN